MITFDSKTKASSDPPLTLLSLGRRRPAAPRVERNEEIELLTARDRLTFIGSENWKETSRDVVMDEKKFGPLVNQHGCPGHDEIRDASPAIREDDAVSPYINMRGFWELAISRSQLSILPKSAT